MMRAISIKEMILLFLRDHLHEQLSLPTGKTPPSIFSQPGITEALGRSKQLVSYGIAALTKEGLIRKRRFYVKETGRFRNFYFLTEMGIQRARELREDIGERVVRVREKEEIKEMRIRDLIEYLRRIAVGQVEQGTSYIIKDERSDKAYEVFRELIKEGYSGLILSDVSPRKIEKKYGIREEIYWFSEVEGENTLRPDRLDSEITRTITSFLRENEKTVILLEGLAYLVQINGFDACVRFLKTLSDAIAQNDGVLLLPLNPVVFDEKEMALLSKYMETYDPKKVISVEINYTNIIRNITPDGFLDIRTILEPRRYVDYSDKRPEIKYFVGRKQELREIKGFLKSKTKVLCVKGIAGIGKTTLLSKFIEDVEMDVFWYRLSEFSTLRGLLTKIADFLSRIERRKLQNYLMGERFVVEEILILLEEELKGCNALFVFDDFHKANKEIVDFFRSLKDLDIKMVVMGRTIPLFYDRRDVAIKKNIREMVLTGLDRESSIKMLKHRKIEKDLDELYHITKGHPLLLELITPETKTEGEEFLKEEIIKKLSPKEKKALEMGSAFRYPFPAKAIMIEDIDHETIDNLVDKSLMQRSGDVYDLHDLIKEIIYNRLSKEQKTRYHKSIAEYFEREQGEGAILEAIYHLLKAEEYEKVSWLIAEKGETLIEKGFLKELDDLIKQIPKNRVSTANWAEILKIRGILSKFLGEWDKALTQLRECIRVSRELENKRLQGECYYHIGEILMNKAEYDKAYKNLQESLQIFEDIEDLRGTAKVNYLLGKSRWRRGKLDDAEEHLQKCLNLAEKIGDERLKAMAYNGLGVVHGHKGECKKALELMMKCLQYFERIDNKYEMVNVQNNIGATYARMNDFRKAIEWYEKCVKTSRDAGIVRGMGYGLANSASNYAKLGEELDKAKEYIDEALDIFNRLGEKRMIGGCYDTYGIIYHKKNEYDKAVECFEKAIKIEEEIESLEFLSEIYRDYARMLADKGDRAKAREMFEKAIACYEKLGNKVKVEEVKKELEGL
ncbi:hypothetical protein DRP04_12010 [Archaeoglobales archaeon]|nr:MAG: hypothetical protein DRP04_12010 [Archaeoglobales archaeon]